MTEQKLSNIFPARGAVRTVEIEVPDRPGIFARVRIRRVRPEVKSRWAQARQAHELAEKKRLAVLRREYSRDDMPELYERPQLDLDGKPVALALEDPHLDAKGRPVMVAATVDINGTEVEVEVQARKPRIGKDRKPVFVAQMLPPMQTEEGIKEVMELGVMALKDAVEGVDGLVFGEQRSDDITDIDGIVEVIETLGISDRVAREVFRIQNPSARQLF